MPFIVFVSEWNPFDKPPNIYAFLSRQSFNPLKTFSLSCTTIVEFMLFETVIEFHGNFRFAGLYVSHPLGNLQRNFFLFWCKFRIFSRLFPIKMVGIETRRSKCYQSFCTEQLLVETMCDSNSEFIECGNYGVYNDYAYCCILCTACWSELWREKFCPQDYFYSHLLFWQQNNPHITWQEESIELRYIYYRKRF